jgi:hypothetical protein
MRDNHWGLNPPTRIHPATRKGHTPCATTTGAEPTYPHPPRHTERAHAMRDNHWG